LEKVELFMGPKKEILQLNAYLHPSRGAKLTGEAQKETEWGGGPLL